VSQSICLVIYWMDIMSSFFFNHILEFFMANCVDLLCRIKSFCNKYKRMCFLTLDFVFG